MPREHIEVRNNGRCVEVVVDDYELMDYVDDLLVAADLGVARVRSLECDGRTLYKMYVHEDVEPEQVREVLDRIPAGEVERIWALNHAAPNARSTPTTLQRVEQWYRAQCDGDWEHQHGVKIGTLDNPGWMVDISLSGTALEDVAFELVTVERSEEDWMHLSVAERVFCGRGGAGNLEEILTRFLGWAGAVDGEPR